MNYIKIELIEEYMAENNLMAEEFCKLCGIKTGVLNKIFIEDYNFELTNLFKIAKLMGKKVYELVN